MNKNIPRLTGSVIFFASFILSGCTGNRTEEKQAGGSVPVQTISASVNIFGVAPYSASVPGSTGGTASFAVAGGTGPYTVTPDNPLYPATPTATGFDVVVAADPLWVAGTVINVIYTVTDATGQTATVTFQIN